MTAKLLAEITTRDVSRTRHTMNGTAMPPAQFLITKEHPEGTYLFRYSEK